MFPSPSRESEQEVRVFCTPSKTLLLSWRCEMLSWKHYPFRLNADGKTFQLDSWMEVDHQRSQVWIIQLEKNQKNSSSKMQNEINPTRSAGAVEPALLPLSLFVAFLKKSSRPQGLMSLLKWSVTFHIRQSEACGGFSSFSEMFYD